MLQSKSMLSMWDIDSALLHHRVLLWQRKLQTKEVIDRVFLGLFSLF